MHSTTWIDKPFRIIMNLNEKLFDLKAACTKIFQVFKNCGLLQYT